MSYRRAQAPSRLTISWRSLLSGTQFFILSACGNSPANLPPATATGTGDTASATQPATPVPTDSGAAAKSLIRADRFVVHATARGRVVSYSLDTDLPDDYEIHVAVYRTYNMTEQDRGTDDYGVYFVNKWTTVGKVRVAHEADIDDSKVDQKIQSVLDTDAGAGYKDKLNRISPKITVEYTGGDTPRLVGRATKPSLVITGARSVSAQSQVYVPYKGSNPNGSAYANAERLEVGQRYRISRATPLSPEFESTDPTLTLGQMMNLPAGTILEIRRIDSQGGSTRYLVRAIGDTERVTGWVSSIALIGQKLQETH